jgi:hypothetical protein
MSFRFYPVPESKIDNVIPLLTEAHGEMDLPKRATLEQARRSLLVGYSNKVLAAYVDDINAPKHLIILSITPGVMFEGLIAFVHLVYSVPEERGKREVLDAMHTTIDNYARFHNAGSIIGSSWVYGNSRPIDLMWTSRGYVCQENVYYKEI